MIGDKPVPHEDRKYILAHNREQYDLYLRENHLEDLVSAFMITDVAPIRGKIFRRDQIVYLEDWWMYFDKPEQLRRIEEAIQCNIWK